MPEVSYLLWLNMLELPLPEGSKEERKAIALSNAQRSQDHFHAAVQTLMDSGKMEGVTIHSKQAMTGSMVVSIPAEKVDKLQKWLTDEKLGDLTENFGVQLID